MICEVEFMDNIVSKHIRQWPELPISATLSSLLLNRSKFGRNTIFHPLSSHNARRPQGIP